MRANANRHFPKGQGGTASVSRHQERDTATARQPEEPRLSIRYIVTCSDKASESTSYARRPVRSSRTQPREVRRDTAGPPEAPAPDGSGSRRLEPRDSRERAEKPRAKGPGATRPRSPSGPARWLRGLLPVRRGGRGGAHPGVVHGARHQAFALFCTCAVAHDENAPGLGQWKGGLLVLAPVVISRS